MSYGRNPLAPFGSSTKAVAEEFSTDGPRKLYYNADGTALTPNDLTSSGGRIIHKPDFVAIDAVSTSLQDKPLNPFTGTSASAQQAAGIAALIWSCNPSLTAAQVRNALDASAIPTEDSPGGATMGKGIIMADGAARIVCAATRTPD